MLWIPVVISVLSAGIAIAAFVRVGRTQRRDRLLQVERRRQECLNGLFALELTHMEELRVLKKVRTPALFAFNTDRLCGTVEGLLEATRLARQDVAKLDMSMPRVEVELILEKIVGQLAILEKETKRGTALTTQVEAIHARLVSGLGELSPEEARALTSAIESERSRD